MIRRPGALLSLTLLLGGCVDGPGAPSVPGGVGILAFEPSFSFAQAEDGASALAAAFDRVNRFRIVLTRIPGGELALDTTVEVTPGQEVYDLSLEVELWSDDESFSAVITALEDDVVLFTSPPITVHPTLPGESAPAPINIPLSYAGPGASATSIAVTPSGVALNPGTSQRFSVEITDASGTLLIDVPVVWTVDEPAIASVSSDGMVQAREDGRARVTVTTPTSLSASAWIYVASGEIAFARDGHIFAGPLSTQGSTDLTPEADNAGAPAWSADGSTLYFHDGGEIYRAGNDEPLAEGRHPAVHPDGTRLAADREGAVYFLNSDGTNPTQGPPGSNPQWDVDGEHLFLAGGSLQRVRADDTDRRTLDRASGVQLPFLCLCGETLAYLQGGSVYVITSAGGAKERLLPAEGQGELTALSRPTMSDDGLWVLAAAQSGGTSALFLMPADGSGPPLLLAGSEEASDPAWKPGGTLAEPVTVAVEGYEPAEPAPGDEVVISGSGFDWIIPDNNQVYFPAPEFTAPSENDDGTGVPGDILGATFDALRTRVPEAVGVGHITVGTNTGGESAASFTPAPGAIAAVATKPPRAGVAGVELSLRKDGSQVATATTDASGQARFDRVETGVYQLHATPPDGFVLDGSPSASGGAAVQNPQEVRVAPAQTATAPVPLNPLLHTVRIRPQRATVDVGGSTWFSVQLLDIVGDPFPDPPPITWSAGSDYISVTGYGQRGLVTGIYPTSSNDGASLVFTVEDRMRTVPITVNSYITGRVTSPGGGALEGVRITARQGGRFLGSVTTGANGRYGFQGIPGGSVTVQPVVGAGQAADPHTASVTLDRDNPRGQADFVLRSPVPEGDGGIVVFGDLNLWGSSSSYLQTSDHRQLTENLVTNSGRTGVVWYFGHDSWVGSPNTYFSYAIDFVRVTLGRTLDVVTTGTTGSLSIPEGAAAFWIWLPQDPLSAADMDEIRRYVDGGGLVVLVGENYVSVFDDANANVQSIMTAMGSGATYVDACLQGETTEIADHPLMTNVASITTACTSYFIPGSGDTALVRQNGTPVVILLGPGEAGQALRAKGVEQAPEPDALADPTDPGGGAGVRPSSGSGGG